MTTRLSRLRLWLLDHLPIGILAQPAEWFLAILCLFSGVSIVTGVSDPRSVSALLWQPVFYAWGAALIAGGLSLICGLTSYRRTPRGNWAVTRVPCYRLGLRLLGMASAVYAASIIIAVGWNGLPAAAITLAFSLMFGVRLLALGSSR